MQEKACRYIADKAIVPKNWLTYLCGQTINSPLCEDRPWKEPQTLPKELSDELPSIRHEIYRIWVAMMVIKLWLDALDPVCV